ADDAGVVAVAAHHAAGAAGCGSAAGAVGWGGRSIMVPRAFAGRCPTHARGAAPSHGYGRDTCAGDEGGALAITARGFGEARGSSGSPRRCVPPHPPFTGTPRTRIHHRTPARPQAQAT